MRSPVRLIAIGVVSVGLAAPPPARAAECPSAQVKPQFQQPTGSGVLVTQGAAVKFKGSVLTPGGCTLPPLELNLQFIRQSPAPQQGIGALDTPIQGGQFAAERVLAPGGTYLVKARLNRKTEGWPSYGTLTEISFTVSLFVDRSKGKTPIPGGAPPVKP